jgi:hypothetical protein
MGRITVFENQVEKKVSDKEVEMKGTGDSIVMIDLDVDG